MLLFSNRKKEANYVTQSSPTNRTCIRISVPFRRLLVCFSTRQGLNRGWVCVSVDDELNALFIFFISLFLHPHVNELLMISQALAIGP